jgi:enamine deaminase RidA (YjgF/YER057c/UK114 family)
MDYALRMTLERINPDGLATPETYTHVVVADGSRLVFVAGQVAEDEHGNVVGRDDMPTQARQVFSNVGRALTAAGVRPEHVVRLGIFVVALHEDHLPAIEAARVALFGEHKPVDTLLGVHTLAHPGCLLEVDAMAIIGG